MEPRPAAVHGGPYLAHHRAQSGEHRLADQEMSDIELDHLAESCNFFCGRKVETVTGVDFEPCGFGESRAARDAIELRFCRFQLACGDRIAPGPSVDLDHRRPDDRRRACQIEAAMNSETRIPASTNSQTAARKT